MKNPPPSEEGRGASLGGRCRSRVGSASGISIIQI